ncbi:MAG: alpha/beta hydrolase [Kiritimatiellales bacterium]|nr:alpha/beta hydrolase [Kiritimatiellales bacterium]
MKMIKGTLPCGTTSPSPEIRCWIPDHNPEKTGLIIFPGGGYSTLADHEGAGYAEYFSKQGIACFVVTYRLGTQDFRHPAMLEDALAAIYTIRSKAAEFGIDPHKLGVLGSSAGGHLAACSLVLWNQYSCEIPLRPDFGILCYPVISSGEHTHGGSFRNLLGETPDPALLKQLSCEKQVSPETPPCFIWHTSDDPVVPVKNSLLFASALSRNKVPFELHIYPHGRHGLGLTAPFDWAADCLRWLGAL